MSSKTRVPSRSGAIMGRNRRQHVTWAPWVDVLTARDPRLGRAVCEAIVMREAALLAGAGSKTASARCRRAVAAAERDLGALRLGKFKPGTIAAQRAAAKALREFDRALELAAGMAMSSPISTLVVAIPAWVDGENDEAIRDAALEACLERSRAPRQGAGSRSFSKPELRRGCDLLARAGDRSLAAPGRLNLILAAGQAFVDARDAASRARRAGEPPERGQPPQRGPREACGLGEGPVREAV